jgi:basic membrane protein A
MRTKCDAARFVPEESVATEGSISLVRSLRLLAVAVVVVAVAAAAGSIAAGAQSGAEPFRVCLVTDTVGLAWNSFDALEAEGLIRAEAELGVTGMVLASAAKEDYLPNLARCAQDGADLTIAAGFLLADAARQAALQFPGSKFAIVDYSVDQPPANLEGLLFRSQEAGYLAGYLAALMSKSGTIASVGGIGLPSVDSWISGYQAGARAANPKIVLLNDYSNSFVDEGACHAVALGQIERGADVVFNVAGGCGKGALAAASEKGVWGIGVDVDQSYLGPHILASAVKRVDEAVFQTIKMMLDRKPIGGGNIAFGLAEHWVDLAGISSAVPQQILDRVAQQRPRPQIGQSTIVPRPTAGKRVTISFRVTRTDTGEPLAAADAIAADPTVAGKPVKHVERFTYGVARVTLTLPKKAKGKKLTVKLTVGGIGRSDAATVIFAIR